MKHKFLFLIVFLGISINSFAQSEISAGMGVSYRNETSITDYIDRYFASERLPSFHAVVEGFFEYGYQINDKYTIGVDYSYIYYSYSAAIINGRYDFDYALHSPSLMIYYSIYGGGYKFNVGGGAGYRFADIDERYFIAANKYNASGFGALLKAAGMTTLGGNFYANISGQVRFDLPGEIETDSGYSIKLTSLSVGVKLGITYIF